MRSFCAILAAVTVAAGVLSTAPSALAGSYTYGSYVGQSSTSFSNGQII